MKYGQDFFEYGPHNQKVLWNHSCLFASHYFCRTVQHFSEEKIYRKFIFAHISTKRAPETLSFDLPESSQKGELLWYLASNPKFYVWHISSSWVITRLALNRPFAEVQEVQYFKDELRHKVGFSACGWQINWSWSGMSGHAQITSKW